MKIICTKSNLVKGVSIVSKAVPSKTTMPILECILIDATTDIIKLPVKKQNSALQLSQEMTSPIYLQSKVMILSRCLNLH